MNHKIIGMLVCSCLLMGCATSQQPSLVSNLQIKVAHLEKKLQARDEEINALKYDIQELASQIETLETFQMPEPVSSYSPGGNESVSSESKASSAADDRIIRVSVTEKQVQKALQEAGYYSGSIDGKIGNMTKKAIREFQVDHELKADGIVGRKTWEQLKAYLD